MGDINTVADLYRMLDRDTEGVNWEDFYIRRDKPAPFLKYNRLPDRCVADFIRGHAVKTACEFGCGEGRNAIYLQKNHIDTEAYDLSEAAIGNAKRIAEQCGVKGLALQAGNLFELDFSGRKFDLVIDSGLFHHLSPHRRLQYRETVSDILAPNGHFLLLCFAAGAGGADVIDDAAFYKSRQTGAAFTPKRLRRFWGEDFDILTLRQGEDVADGQVWESSLLFICLLKKKSPYPIP